MRWPRATSATSTNPRDRGGDRGGTALIRSPQAQAPSLSFPLQVATLHHHSADEGLPPAEVMHAYIDALPSGSYVVFSHFFDPENEHSAIAHRVQAILNSSISRGFFRTRAEIEEMLTGLELVDPGIAVADEWWPDGPAKEPLPDAGRCIVAVLGRKP